MRRSGMNASPPQKRAGMPPTSDRSSKLRMIAHPQQEQRELANDKIPRSRSDLLCRRDSFRWSDDPDDDGWC
jgi:hypothetical protein